MLKCIKTSCILKKKEVQNSNSDQIKIDVKLEIPCQVQYQTTSFKLLKNKNII